MESLLTNYTLENIPGVIPPPKHKSLSGLKIFFPTFSLKFWGFSSTIRRLESLDSPDKQWLTGIPYLISDILIDLKGISNPSTRIAAHNKILDVLGALRGLVLNLSTQYTPQQQRQLSAYAIHITQMQTRCARLCEQHKAVSEIRQYLLNDGP